jgi:predicted amidohydrolase
MLRVALAQYQVTKPADLASFLAGIEALCTQARGRADLLVLPEYAAMALAGAFVSAPDVQAELAAVVSRSADILDGMKQIAKRQNIWLLGGSLPMQDGSGAIFNRAPLIEPGGKIEFQDKHVMTRFERESWHITQGALPRIFDTPWGKIGIAICYDSEFPSLVRSQVRAGAFAILVPTCTDTLAGFNRVRLSARARAIENQCYVGMSPTIGAAPWSATLDDNQGYAAAFGPVDRGFPDDGVLARGVMNQPGLVFADLDPQRIERVRQTGAVLNHADWPE